MTATSRSSGPLSGMHVLDCTHVIAGAWCSMLLADLGADVVKIEPPMGEVTRTSLGPFRAYDFVNRNKRAIAMDMTKTDGAAALRRLAGRADVWVENFRAGALDRVGLGYDDLARVNPQLIYCSISGFGHDGPYRERGADRGSERRDVRRARRRRRVGASAEERRRATRRDDAPRVGARLHRLGGGDVPHARNRRGAARLATS